MALVVPSCADQLILQLLIDFDILPSQCRHIEHMHEEVWFQKHVCQNDTVENEIIQLLTYVEVDMECY